MGSKKGKCSEVFGGLKGRAKTGGKMGQLEEGTGLGVAAKSW